MQAPPGGAPWEGSEEIDFDTIVQTALTHPDRDERMGAVVALREHGDEQALPILKQALEDPDPEVRITVVEELGEMENPPFDVLATALRDSDADVRIAVVQALAGVNTPQALDLMRLVLDDPDPDVRDTALLYLEGEPVIGAGGP